MVGGVDGGGLSTPAATTVDEVLDDGGSPSSEVNGSPAEVTDKILAAHEIFRFDRFLIQMAIGVMDHVKLMRAIEVLGTRVAPEVRKALRS